MKKILVSILLFVSLILPVTAIAQTLAFPDAEGYGRFSIGGRAGKVYHVTSLADSGPGTLREACEASGPRTVVFDISGTIDAKTEIIISNPYITIAGQTAPAPGILVKTMILVKTQHVQIRYLQVRPGARAIPLPDDTDAIKVIAPSQHVIVDHTSLSWGSDKILTAWGSQDITFSYNIIAEGLGLPTPPHVKGYRAKGLLVGGSGSDRVTVHHNLLVNNWDRNPLLNGIFTVDVRANYIYNFLSGTTVYPFYSITRANIVGNRFHAGPGTDKRKPPVRLMGNQPFHNGSGAYIADNELVGYSTDKVITFTSGPPNLPTMTNPYATPIITNIPISDSDWQNLLDNVGATIPVRNTVDDRLLKEVRSGQGKFPDMPSDVGGFPSITVVRRAPDYDTDGDGIPNVWELRNGLNPNDITDGSKKSSNGYTNLENFLNNVSLEPKEPTLMPPSLLCKDPGFRCEN
jgi:pectate lyase